MCTGARARFDVHCTFQFQILRFDMSCCRCFRVALTTLIALAMRGDLFEKASCQWTIARIAFGNGFQHRNYETMVCNLVRFHIEQPFERMANLRYLEIIILHWNIVQLTNHILIAAAQLLSVLSQFLLSIVGVHN